MDSHLIGLYESVIQKSRNYSQWMNTLENRLHKVDEQRSELENYQKIYRLLQQRQLGQEMKSLLEIMPKYPMSRTLHFLLVTLYEQMSTVKITGDVDQTIHSMINQSKEIQDQMKETESVIREYDIFIKTLTDEKNLQSEFKEKRDEYSQCREQSNHFVDNVFAGYRTQSDKDIAVLQSRVEANRLLQEEQALRRQAVQNVADFMAQTISL